MISACVSLTRKGSASFHWLGVVFLAVSCSDSVDVTRPNEIAIDFLQAVRIGDASEALQSLEDRDWRVPPLGGDEAYFEYESGHEPNLAFLLGRPFEFQIADVKGSRPSDSLPIMGTRYADVRANLSFSDGSYSPYLLPLPVAFGQSVSEEEFSAFVADPTKFGAAALGMRLRPSIDPGLIRLPELRHLEIPPPPVQPADTRQSRSSVLIPPLEKSLGWGRIPRDAGDILLPSGAPLPSSRVRELLPRLRQLDLQVRLQKASWYQAWGTHSFYFGEALVETDTGLHRIHTGKR